MISVPIKATNEVDWVHPLKQYIRNTYGDDPERYAEECETLNRLRQDMRGAGKESTSGRDMLYRYYGQLELLDLRFPIDELHIKISFTWYVTAGSAYLRILRLIDQTPTNHHLGSMHLHTSPRRNTPWPLKRHPSSSTYPPFSPHTPLCRTDQTTPP